MPEEQSKWTEFLNWYVLDYNELSQDTAYAFAPTLEEQANILFTMNLLNEANSLLDTLGVEGQISYESYNGSWGQRLAIQQAFHNHLRQTVFNWFGDHYPSESKAVLLGLVKWAPNFIMEKLSAPTELRKLTDKIITTYLGGNVDAWLGIDKTQAPAAVIDQMYDTLTDLKESSDKYMPLIADFMVRLGHAQEEASIQMANLGDGILYAIGATADDLALHIDSNHAQVTAMFKDLGLAVESVKELLMTEMLVAADQMAFGLSANAELDAVYRDLQQAYTDGDADAFRLAYLRWAGLTAERREQMQIEEQRRFDEERDNQLAEQRTLNDFRMVIKLAEMFIPFIKDQDIRRFTKSMAILMSGGLTLAGSLSTTGPVGIVAGVVVIAVSMLKALKDKQQINEMNELYEALATLLDMMYTQLDQRIRDSIVLSEYNHREVMSALRDLQLSNAGIAAAVGRALEGQSFIVRQIDEFGQAILQLTYTTVISDAEIAAGEYNDPSLDVVTEADLHTYVRNWFSFMKAIPPNPAASHLSPDPLDESYDTSVFYSANNYPLASLLNIIDEDAAWITEGERLSSKHINPEFLWEMLPDLERYLTNIADGFTLSESTYRQRLVELFHQCQNVIGLRLSIAANTNLFRQLFWQLYYLLDRYENGVYELFWDEGNTVQKLNDYYRQPSSTAHLRTHLGDQVINSYYAQMQYPQFTTQFLFERNRFSSKWTASDKLGLIYSFTHDRMKFENVSENQATLAYFDDVPQHDAGDNAVIVYYKDLRTPEQWRIALLGKSEMGLDYDLGPSLGTGTVTVDLSQYYPQLDESQLKNLIVDGIEYSDGDVVKINTTGKVDLRDVLNRSLYKLMQEEDGEYYESLNGSSFITHTYPSTAVNAFFLSNQGVDQAETDFATGLRGIFVRRFHDITILIPQKPPSPNPAINFATILNEVSVTIARTKMFVEFAFHNEPYVTAINGFLDRIEQTLSNFEFGDFDPLKITDGFASAIGPIRRDVVQLANIIDHETQRTRQRIMLEQPLNEDFGNCREMMRVIDRICKDYFGRGLEASEIVNEPLNTAVQGVLDAPLIEELPIATGTMPSDTPIDRIKKWMKLIDLGSALRNDPRFTKFGDTNLGGQWAGIGEDTYGLLMGGMLGDKDWDKRRDGLYKMIGDGAALTKKQIDLRLMFGDTTHAESRKLLERHDGPILSQIRPLSMVARRPRA